MAEPLSYADSLLQNKLFIAQENIGLIFGFQRYDAVSSYRGQEKAGTS